MTDSDRPVPLTSVANDIEAAAIVAALEVEGIQAESVGDFTAGFRAEAPGSVQIVVKESELATAQKVLNDLPEDEPIDWDNVDVGEPEDN